MEDINPYKYETRNFHPMTSNSFQLTFWIIFNYVYSLSKPETLSLKIQKANWKEFDVMGKNYVFCTYWNGLLADFFYRANIFLL